MSAILHNSRQVLQSKEMDIKTNIACALYMKKDRARGQCAVLNWISAYHTYAHSNVLTITGVLFRANLV